MSADLERLPDQIDPQTQHMLDLALMKARDIEGTYLSDLEAALNMIRQYRRSLSMVGAPDPNGTAATNMLKKYNMYGAIKRPKDEDDTARRDRQARELTQALTTLSSARAQAALMPPPKQLGTGRSEDLDVEIVDAEVVE
jgi:hypothetical protein